jgi:hypothetical protein
MSVKMFAVPLVAAILSTSTCPHSDKSSTPHLGRESTIPTLDASLNFPQDFSQPHVSLTQQSILESTLFANTSEDLAGFLAMIDLILNRSRLNGQSSEAFFNERKSFYNSLQSSELAKHLVTSTDLGARLSIPEIKSSRNNERAIYRDIPGITQTLVSINSTPEKVQEAVAKKQRIITSLASENSVPELQHVNDKSFSLRSLDSAVNPATANDVPSDVISIADANNSIFEGINPTSVVMATAKEMKGFEDQLKKNPNLPLEKQQELKDKLNQAGALIKDALEIIKPCDTSKTTCKETFKNYDTDVKNLEMAIIGMARLIKIDPGQIKQLEDGFSIMKKGMEFLVKDNMWGFGWTSLQFFSFMFSSGSSGSSSSFEMLARQLAQLRYELRELRKDIRASFARVEQQIRDVQAQINQNRILIARSFELLSRRFDKIDQSILALHKNEYFSRLIETRLRNRTLSAEIIRQKLTKEKTSDVFSSQLDIKSREGLSLLRNLYLRIDVPGSGLASASLIGNRNCLHNTAIDAAKGIVDLSSGAALLYHSLYRSDYEDQAACIASISKLASDKLVPISVDIATSPILRGLPVTYEHGIVNLKISEPFTPLDAYRIAVDIYSAASLIQDRTILREEIQAILNHLSPISAQLGFYFRNKADFLVAASYYSLGRDLLWDTNSLFMNRYASAVKVYGDYVNTLLARYFSTPLQFHTLYPIPSDGDFFQIWDSYPEGKRTLLPLFVQAQTRVSTEIDEIFMNSTKALLESVKSVELQKVLEKPLGICQPLSTATGECFGMTRSIANKNLAYNETTVQLIAPTNIAFKSGTSVQDRMVVTSLIEAHTILLEKLFKSFNALSSMNGNPNNDEVKAKDPLLQQKHAKMVTDLTKQFTDAYLVASEGITAAGNRLEDGYFAYLPLLTTDEIGAATSDDVFSSFAQKFIALKFLETHLNKAHYVGQPESSSPNRVRLTFGDKFNHYFYLIQETLRSRERGNDIHYLIEPIYPILKHELKSPNSISPKLYLQVAGPEPNGQGRRVFYWSTDSNYLNTPKTQVADLLINLLKSPASLAIANNKTVFPSITNEYVFASLQEPVPTAKLPFTNAQEKGQCRDETKGMKQAEAVGKSMAEVKHWKGTSLQLVNDFCTNYEEIEKLLSVGKVETISRASFNPAVGRLFQLNDFLKTEVENVSYIHAMKNKLPRAHAKMLNAEIKK